MSTNQTERWFEFRRALAILLSRFGHDNLKNIPRSDNAIERQLDRIAIVCSGNSFL